MWRIQPGGVFTENFAIRRRSPEELALISKVRRNRDLLERPPLIDDDFLLPSRGVIGQRSLKMSRLSLRMHLAPRRVVSIDG